MSRQPREIEAATDAQFPFEGLDFIYTPSSDVAADAAFFVDVLGARLVFAIEATDTRVAMIDLTGGPPRIIFADHLAGERPILVYWTRDLENTTTVLAARGWSEQRV